MNKTLTLILGDQLFENHPGVNENSNILMVESFDECQRLPYHKFKLVYLLTLMREFRDSVQIKFPKLSINYYQIEEKVSFLEALKKLVQEHKFTVLECCQVNSKYFKSQLETWCKDLGLEFKDLESRMFLTSKNEFKNYFETQKTKSLKMQNFYIWQRRRLNILCENDKPFGGQWSFDKENRKKLPKNIAITERGNEFISQNYSQVCKSIKNLFPNNPGVVKDSSWLPLNHNQANSWMESFFKNYLENFGDYEDALTNKSDMVFHSGLSPLLNYGLLTPNQVLFSLNNYLENGLFDSQKFDHDRFKINSIEGFIRQIIGWREWIKGLYDNVYNDQFLELNFFDSTVSLPNYFYDYNYSEEVKNNLPLVYVLDKVNNLAYAHHIERLMVLSNWMTLSEYSPRECFIWFSSQFVDASEWVMVGNVMGMGLFADGGIFATKPYISGGNYLKKMSDFQDSKIWEKIWTQKFWAYLEKHKSFFMKQPRLAMLLKSKK